MRGNGGKGIMRTDENCVDTRTLKGAVCTREGSNSTTSKELYERRKKMRKQGILKRTTNREFAEKLGITKTKYMKLKKRKGLEEGYIFAA
jgi:hypothetical protein